MKKIILTMALSVSMISFAQDKSVDEKNESSKNEKPLITLSANLSGSDAGFVGVSLEVQDLKDRGSSRVFNLNYGAISVDDGGVDYTGSGYSIEGGFREYFSKGANNKFYVENLATYTRFEFSDVNYTGVYEYFSILNASFGYKWNIGKHLTIDPSLGAIWKLEIRGGGDVDNKSFDNFVGKYAVKIGYRF